MSLLKPKQYWMSLVERDTPHLLPRELENGDPDFTPTRRSFLKAAGFTFGALTVSGCRAPEVDAIPFAQQPEGLVPGRALLYATTCSACEARCGLLVTTRDGRPLKIEGNPEHPFSGGSTCAVGQASLLGLYDSLRLAHPVKGGQRVSWADADREIVGTLDRLKQEGRPIRLLTHSVTSPTLAASIASFLAAYPSARHITYDPLSSSALLDAYEQTFGVRLLPQYRFERADVVVSFDADFLGTWVSPLQHMRGYMSRRRIDDRAPGKSYHVQVESRLSLTGSNADRRVAVAPGEMAHAVTHVADAVVRLSGRTFTEGGLAPSMTQAAMDTIALLLMEASGRSLVVSGSQDVRVQRLCAAINEIIGAHGTTVDLVQPSFQRSGSDTALAALRAELSRGEVGALIVAGANPVYDLPDGAALAKDLERVQLVVSTAERADETASAAHFICPDHHFLESWGDAEAVSGVVSLTQPTIRPLHETRALIESLSAWAGTPQPELDLVRAHWQTAMHPRDTGGLDFKVFWDRTLERGVADLPPAPPAAGAAAPAFNMAAVTPVLMSDPAPSDGFALVLYPKVGLLDGRHAHNAWLQELPDPVTKVTWDNYACLSPAAAGKLGIKDGDILRVAAADGGTALELPAFVQPGQHDGVVAIAIGYGRAGTDRFAKIGPPWFEARTLPGPVGVNAAPFITIADGLRQYAGRRVTVTKTGAWRQLASTQVHHSLEPPGSVEKRPIVQEMTLSEVAKTGDTQAEGVHEAGDLWPDDHPREGHRWGLSIDLSSCTGCSACMVACQAENNVPVVGYDEVRRNREMHWLRIDRYYAEHDDQLEVAHQPMMCQHCGHAPCETVCPVLATVHSDEGLNEQVYNRCVGTRYCANNCPYKVRRFNWFDYPHEDRLQNLVFNPNVTVRSRGVMEKCSLCVQRIEEQKIEAKRLGIPLADGAIKTACEQVCPTQAIVFGDLNDPESRVSRLSGSKRTYRVLEELNTQPAVRYLKLVRHDPPPPAEEDPSRG